MDVIACIKILTATRGGSGLPMGINVRIAARFVHDFLLSMLVFSGGGGALKRRRIDVRSVHIGRYMQHVTEQRLLLLGVELGALVAGDNAS